MSRKRSAAGNCEPPAAAAAAAVTTPPPISGWILCLLLSRVTWTAAEKEQSFNSVETGVDGLGVQVDHAYYVDGENDFQVTTVSDNKIVAHPTTTAPSFALGPAPTYSSPPRSSTPPPPLPGSPTLRVLNLNTWGLNWPWSVDRRARYKALAEIIALSDYDFILLQEVWFRSDYAILRRAAPYVAEFESYNLWCKWLYFPLHCSGLTILSRHPIADQDFMPFSRLGSFWNFDGEIFTNKGVARARVYWHGLSVDVFTTHMVSYSKNPNSDNSHFRVLQSRETLSYVSSSDADVKILGGDLNSLPLRGDSQPYGILRTHLRDALTDRYPAASHDPFFATFGNQRNTYSGRYHEERIDYLLFYARPHSVEMRVVEFSMPSFMAHDAEGKLISVSDHSPLDVQFAIRKREPHEIVKVEEEHGINDISSNLVESNDWQPRSHISTDEYVNSVSNGTVYIEQHRNMQRHNTFPHQQQQHRSRYQHHRRRRPLLWRRRRRKKQRPRSGLLRHFDRPKIELPRISTSQRRFSLF